MHVNKFKNSYDGAKKRKKAEMFPAKSMDI